jgi:iron complex transport system substrate-binding protein
VVASPATRLLAALLLAAAVAAGVACGAGSVEREIPPAEDRGYPRVVVDDLGREVELPDRPEAVGSLAPSITETLFALGAEDRLAGVTTADDYPPEVADYPVIGGYREPNFERVVALGIDLLFVSSEAATGDEAEDMERLGRAAVVVVDPGTVEEAISSIGLVGEAVGEEEAARELQGELRAELAAVEEAVAGEPRPRVFYEVWPDPLRTVGPGSFIHDAITLAGGENVAAGTGEAYPTYSEEALLRQDPDYYLVGSETTEEERRAAFAALREGRVVRIEEDLVNRPGPRVVEGVRELARAIHPEAFEGSGER